MYNPMMPMIAQQMSNMDVGMSVASTMSLLQHLENQELQELLNEDTRLDPMLLDTAHVKSLDSDKEMLLASNKSLADYNLSFEHGISSGKQRLIELYQLASDVASKVQEKEKKLEESENHVNMETAIVLVQTAAAQAEEDTESVADSFLEGKIDVESFIDSFTAQRKLAHVRRVKADKLQEIAKQRGKSNRQAPTRPPTNQISPSHPLPYPVSNSPMAPYTGYPRLE